MALGHFPIGCVYSCTEQIKFRAIYCRVIKKSQTVNNTYVCVQLNPAVVICPRTFISGREVTGHGGG